MKPIWIVDDDASIRWVLEKALARESLETRSFANAREALTAFETDTPQVLVSDIRMPGESGIDLLQAVKARHPGLPVIIITAFSDLDSAVSSFQGGAFDYLAKPFDIDKAVALIRRALEESLREASVEALPAETPEILGHAPAMQEVFRAIGRLSQSNVTVLITGESGTGKELVARALHKHSPRAAQPFIALNTAAIPKDLLESELFGHERGAFTGATRDKQGLLEAASGGSIFLDEIGDLPLDLQASLLRFLQERVIYRVGGTRTIAVDARVIAATHVNLPQAVAEGRFREDLYYRLSVFPIRVPPLRERKEDLPLLTDLIFNKYAAERSPQLKGVSREALQAMARYEWPGNVRELINRVRRAMVLAEQRLVMPEDLDLPSAGPICPVKEGLGNSRLSAERIAIGESLARSGNNISQAARDLGVSRMTLYRLMAKHAISS